ncbi:MAG TPA: hypothetical protein VG797_08765 [Phycisphaerales bacterium]|nr:hypothetical protein [Phycisphaerales bacterium]
MSTPARPHVSAALQHLRFGVTASAAALALALLGQVLLWCFVFFTDVRQTKIEPHPPEQSNAVVTHSRTEKGKKPEPAVAVHEQPAEAQPPPAEPAPQVASAPTTVDPNVVPSENDARLRAASRVVQTAGIITAILLIVLMLEGVAVAGGGSVPGVEMAVTAATWAVLIGLLAVPLNGILTESAWGGVFVPYEQITRMSDAYRAGSGDNALIFYGRFLLLPLLMIAGAAASALRFRGGVEAGVIATSISQLDEQLEKEIRSMKLGQTASPRASGALHQVIAPTMIQQSTPQPPPPVVAPQPAPAPVRQAPPGFSAASDASQPLRRPI